MSFQAILSNFALILFVLTIVTGIIWCLDLFVWSKQRRERANAALAEFDAKRAKLQAEGIRTDEGGRAELQAELLRQPAWIEYSGSFFPVIALVFGLRSFLYEPFKIPSSSMVPTLMVGDLILVNKFTYGIRLPIINKKIIEIGQPKRGDVMVFRYPMDPSQDYIKRVVGVPGDRVEYKNKSLIINGVPLEYEKQPDFLYIPESPNDSTKYRTQMLENLNGVKHKLLKYDELPAFVNSSQLAVFPNNPLCSYNTEGFICTVPAGHYFMMGDNRDNSTDSRYWGFVPDENIVGKAFFVWMNFSDLKRIGSFQ